MRVRAAHEDRHSHSVGNLRSRDGTGNSRTSEGPQQRRPAVGDTTCSGPRDAHHLRRNAQLSPPSGTGIRPLVRRPRQGVRELQRHVHPHTEYRNTQPMDEGGGEKLPKESAAQLLHGRVQLQVTAGILFRRRKVVMLSISVTLCRKSINDGFAVIGLFL